MYIKYTSLGPVITENDCDPLYIDYVHRNAFDIYITESINKDSDTVCPSILAGSAEYAGYMLFLAKKEKLVSTDLCIAGKLLDIV